MGRHQDSRATVLVEHLPSLVETRLVLGRAGSTGEALGRVASLGQSLHHLRVHYEVLEPGHRSSRPHYHVHREECVFITAGTVELQLGEERIPLSVGDFVAIPSGPPFHTVWNCSTQSAEMLVFSSTPQPDEVVYEGASGTFGSADSLS